MREAGVQFYDTNLRFVSKPAVSIIGIGGLPIKIIAGVPTLCAQPITIENLQKDLMVVPGASAAMSYMNPRNKSLTDLADIVIKKHAHYSILHTVYLNIAVFGISSAAEHELDCQRDLVHLSRITVARTKAQSRPSFVVLNPNHLQALAEIVDFVERKIAALPERDDLESTNNLYPSLKAHSVILSGTAKNFIKLSDQISDKGKEQEYRQILTQINALRDWLIRLS